jgi:hypothetical protein
MPPKVIDNETEDEIDTSILAVKPKLKRSVAVDSRSELAEGKEDTEKPKPKRTPAQLAALEKARAKAKEKAELRRQKPVENSKDYEAPEINEVEVEEPVITKSKAKRAARDPEGLNGGFASTPTPFADSDNGWKAFAEYLVIDRERNNKPRDPEGLNGGYASKVEPKAEPRDPKTVADKEAKTVKVLPPRKEISVPKKTAIFS